MGLLSYIPFYYIDFLRGDPVYAGTLVSLFLLGGAAGTLAGGPLADRLGHKFYISLTMMLAALTFPCYFCSRGSRYFSLLPSSGWARFSSPRFP